MNAELPEDVGQVGRDGSPGDVELRRHLGVSQAERHLSDDLLLARCHRIQARIGPIVDRDVVVCHGSPHDEDEYVFNDHHAAQVFESIEGKFILYGHTHRPQVDRHEGVWILNPGSPTERRTAPFRAMLLLEIAGGTVSPELVRLT